MYKGDRGEAWVKPNAAEVGDFIGFKLVTGDLYRKYKSGSILAEERPEFQTQLLELVSQLQSWETATPGPEIDGLKAQITEMLEAVKDETA